MTAQNETLIALVRTHLQAVTTTAAALGKLHTGGIPTEVYDRAIQHLGARNCDPHVGKTDHAAIYVGMSDGSCVKFPVEHPTGIIGVPTVVAPVARAA